MNVYDIKGAKVIARNLNGTTIRFGSNLERGVYFVEFWQNGKSTTQKIIKK